MFDGNLDINSYVNFIYVTLYNDCYYADHRIFIFDSKYHMSQNANRNMPLIYP